MKILFLALCLSITLMIDMYDNYIYLIMFNRQTS